MEHLNLESINIKKLFEEYAYFIIGETEYTEDVWDDIDTYIEGQDTIKTKMFAIKFANAEEMADCLTEISESDGTSEGHEHTKIILQRPNNKDLIYEIERHEEEAEEEKRQKAFEESLPARMQG